MAKFRPQDIDLNVIKTRSLAEAYVLERFLELDSEKTRDWVIFYSYYFKGRKNTLANSGKNHNEIDFLVLAPGVGFFVFEIKGGIISIDDEGRLVSRNRFLNQNFIIEPYVQAKDNYYALKEIVGPLIDGKTKAFFDSFVGGTLIGFPDIVEIPNVGLRSNDKDTYVKGMNLHSFIVQNSLYLKEKSPNKLVPTKADVKLVIEKLIGKNFEYSLSPKEYIKSANIAINQMTEEQMSVFRGLLNNKRCLIEGMAGTGKTLLCEFLYKYLREEKKYNVVYFSFNRLIAERVMSDVNENGSSNCYPIIDYLENMYLGKINKSLPDFKNFSDKKSFLFKQIGELLRDDIHFTKYDCIIVDEAQDIENSDDVILLLDSLLNGGLKDGLCYLFFDDRQDMFNRHQDKIYNSDFFGSEGYRYARFSLLKNCRNIAGIQQSLGNLLKVKKTSPTMKNDNTFFFEIHQNEEGAELIKKQIDVLSKQGVKNNQITILFNLNSENVNNYLFRRLKSIYQKHFEEYSLKSSKRNALTYSTVAKFKGLENDVIFYIDDNPYAHVSNHYIGISRAKAYLYIFKVS